jgi:outer membrane receptor for ferrienterochelin and colicins
MPWRNARFVSALSMILLLGWRLSAQDAAAAAGAGASPESVLFETLPVVEAATLHKQTLEEAPASITVISSRDIRTYGFRTLGEALASVRGFYMTDDRAYHYAGLRGFSLPGDYNTRFLVMLNGHYLTENIYGSNNFFGQDFGLDMDLVERIEIVRGPSSALYGSNGIFATINVVTRSPVTGRRLRASMETGSFGENKVMLSSGMALGHGANLLVSASVFNNGGQSLYFPEFDRSGTNFGRAVDVDGERGYHLFANLIWHNWTVSGYLGSREKLIPTGWYGTIFNDRGNKILDERGFFEAAYSRDLSATRKVRWRIYYDQYRYHGRYDYALTGAIADYRDLGAGDWVGSQLAYDFAIPHVGVLTVGGEMNADIKALQQYYRVSPGRTAVLSADHPDFSYGFFAQQQWRLSRAWNVYLGARFDDSKNHRGFVSPRAALVYQASENSSYKLLYGRAFRNPNAYEMYYADGSTQAANLRLRPEKANTFEASAERRFTKNLTGLATVYHYRLGDLIEAATNAAGWLQYQNIGSTKANGVEVELTGKFREGIETAASVALQRATDPEDHSFLPDSPGCVAKIRGAIPLLKNKLRAATALEYLSAQRTFSYAQVPAFWLTDVTLSTRNLHPDFDLQFGVRNLLNVTYYYPAGIGLTQDQIRADGRSVFLKLVWRTKE